jgi:hypothetical protein
MANRTAASGSGKAKKTTPGSAKSKTGGAKKSAVARKGGRIELVRELIEIWATEIVKDPKKTGVAELIRLLSLEKELGGTTEAVKEIKVTWVEPTTAES